MAQLRQHEKRLEESDIKVIVVTFDSQAMAKIYVDIRNLSWPLLVDSRRVLYKAFGIPRANLWTLLKPKVTWQYINTMAKGYWPGRPGCDPKQLGGNVLIGPDGIVRLNHVSTDPYDRPTVDYILESKV